MPLSEAKKRSNKKWNDANLKETYDRIQLVVPKGRKTELQAHAATKGESLNKFVTTAIDERVAREAGSSSVPTNTPTTPMNAELNTEPAPQNKLHAAMLKEHAESQTQQAQQEDEELPLSVRMSMDGRLQETSKEMEKDREVDVEEVSKVRVKFR